MSTILADLLAVIFISGLTTILCIAGLLLLPRAIYARYKLLNIKTLLIAGVCVVVCLYESVCFSGAMRISRRLNRIVAQTEQLADQTSQMGAERLPEQLDEQLPELVRYLPQGKEHVTTAQDYIAAIRSNIHRYIWARIGWMVGILAVGAVLLARDAQAEQRRASAAQAMLLYMD